MFLFYLRDTKKFILHTGDCRADDSVIENPIFKGIQIDTIYLDTTYCDSYYKFPPQKEIVRMGVELVKSELKKYPKSLIVCGSYTIGKERIFASIASELNAKICVSRDKKNIIDCLEDKQLASAVTLNPNETNLHVVQMGQLNMKDLKEYLTKFPHFERVIAIKPTGWTHNSDSGISVDSKTHNMILYGMV
jgi:DNA cross-link repair 1A protein